MNVEEEGAGKPHFLPPGLDYASLPEAIQGVFVSVIDPLHQELVVAAPNAIERAAGTTIVFWFAEEVLRQSELGGSMDFSHAADEAGRELREKSVFRCLKVSAAKEKALATLIRLRKLNANNSAPEDSPAGAS